MLRAVEPGDPGPSVGPDGPPVPIPLPVVRATSSFAEMSRPVLARREPPSPRTVDRGVVLFDLDGTILDDLALISTVAADVMHGAFGTAPEEARIHYLATTGMPFEAQLAQLYPEAPAPLRAATARTFHQRKVAEAYARAEPFPDVPKLLKRLAANRWTLSVTTGAETEMAELILEREGLRYWFEDVLGSADGTKREHLAEYRRRYPDARTFLVGDSRFDMEAARDTPGVIPLGRASRFSGWALTPSDLKKWGAAWADYRLAELPEVLDRLARRPIPRRTGGARRPSPRRR
jgi:phosphoglycolate phosphatase-like HAD superfamily hydrolase